MRSFPYAAALALTVGAGWLLAAAAPSLAARAPVGALMQLSGRDGCYGTKVRGPCSRVAFDSPHALELAPDGRQLYTVGDSGVKVFVRDSRSGALRPRPRGGLRVRDPGGLSFSPNGRFAYLSRGTVNEYNELAVYARDPASGALSPLPPPGGCLSASPDRGCGRPRAFVAPGVPSFSPDGRSAYVAIGGVFSPAALTAFAADAHSGTLTQLADSAGCTTDVAREGCAVDPLVAPARSPLVSSGGLHAYSATKGGPPSFSGKELLELGRDPATGTLTRIGCLNARATLGCRRARALGDVDGLALTPNGRTLYAASGTGKSIAPFRVGADGRLGQLDGANGCVSSRRGTGCRRGRGLFQPESILVAPGGRSTYVVDVTDAPFGDYGDIIAFKADPRSGALRQLPGRFGCLNGTGARGCTRFRGLRGSQWDAALSPDSRYLYVLSDGIPGSGSHSPPLGSIAVFRRRAGR